jgi:predicted hotdog family 3-hydroxylacyl-ACP dehydratase
LVVIEHAAIDRDAIDALIPHGGRMSLLARVDAWDDDSIRCRTLSHLDPANPLRSGGQLAALHLCEYGAQAMALHGGLLARRDHAERAAPGMLVALRAVEFAVGRIDDIEQVLSVSAQRLLGDAGACLYQFEVSAAGRWLARGRVSVIMQA